jgi:hypothetical protein
MSLAPVAITTSIGYPIKEFQISSLNKLLPKIVLLHLILIISFSLSYYLFNYKSNVNTEIRKSPIYFTNIWYWIAVTFTIVTLLLESILGVFHTRSVGDSNEISAAFHQKTFLLEQQLLLHLRRLRGYAIFFAVGVFVSKAQTVKKARKRLFGAVGLLGIIYFSVFASRGFLFSTFLGAACYADMVRWNGRLFGLKAFLLLIIGGVALLQILNILEAYFVLGHAPTLSNFAHMFVMDYGIVENSAIVANWIDSGQIAMRKGQTYMMALLSALPTQLRGSITFLPTWYAHEMSYIVVIIS